MAAFNIFNSSDEDVDSESLQPGSLGNIFGKDVSEETLDPRGSPTFSDYLYDIIQVAPVKGVRSLVKGVLEIPAGVADFALDTDLVSKLDTFFSEGFAKIPETQTSLGDITSILVQYGFGSGVAARIAPTIMGLRGSSIFTKLDEIPSIAGKAGEIAKRAGYFGGLSGVTDFIASSPGVNQTAGEQFGLYEGYEGEGLRGRDKATELLKSKLKFGAEGATLGGAIPLLPVAGTLGWKYGLKPAGQAVGYVGGNVIRAVDSAVINPIASVVSGGKVANIDVPKIIPNLIKNIYSGVEKVGDTAGKLLLPAKDTPMGKIIDNGVVKFKEWFATAGGVGGEFSTLQAQVFNNADVRAKKASETLLALNKTLEKDIIGKYYKVFNNGESKNIIQYEQSKLLDYFNNNGNAKFIKKTKKEIDPITKKEKTIFEKDPITGKQLYTYSYSESKITQDILNTLDPRVSKDVKEYAQQVKKYLLDIQAELRPYVKPAELKGAFKDYVGTSFKQTLASFNNSRFAFDPLKQKNVVKYFTDELLLSRSDLRRSILNKLPKDTKITNDIFLKIRNKKGNVNEILSVTEQNINQFNKKYNLELDIKSIDNFKKATVQEAERRTLEIKSAAIGTDKDPRVIFSKISEQLGLTNKESLDSLAKVYKRVQDLGGKEKTNLSSIVDYLSTPRGSEAIIRGKKVSIPTSDYTSGILGSILFLNKQEAYRRFFDSLIDLNKRITDPSKKMIYTANEAFKYNKNTNNLKAISFKNREFAENVFESTLMKGSKLDETGESIIGKYYAKPEIVNALRGTDAVFSNLFDIPVYGTLMKLKGVAQVGGTIFSPVAQVRNVTGNAFVALVNGLYGGSTSLSDSFKIITQDIFKGAKINPKLLQDKIDDLVRRGIIDQNIQAQELKKLFEQASKGEVTLDTFMNNQYVKRAVDIYQGADSGWKIFADSFYQNAFGTALKAENPALLKVGTKAYDDFMKEAKDWYKTVAKQEFDPKNYLTGLDKTPLDIIGDMSSFLVRGTMPTYSQVPKAIRGLRNLPFGNFVSFPAEIIRNSANIISIGARELTSTNPFIRQMGARRLMGAAAGFGGVGYVTKKTAEALTGVDEDKMEAFQRSFAAQYQKNSTLIPVSAPDENGNFKYYNFSYTNPYDSLVRPVNAVLNAFADGSLNKDSVDKIVMNALFGNTATGRTGAVGEFFAPFTDESIGTERAFDIVFRDGVKREGGKVFYPQDDLNTKISKGIQHIAGGVVPGAVKSAQRIWEGATGKFTDAGTVRDMGTELTAITTGIRIEDAKPLASMPFIVTSYNKDKQNVDKKFAEIAYRPSATPEQRLDAYKNYLLESFDSQNKMYQVIKDGTTIGIDETDIKDIVQSRLNNKKETELLFSGVFKVPTFNEKAFDSMIKRLEKEDPYSAVRVESQIDIIKNIYKDINSEFQNFNLETPKEGFQNILNRALTPGVREIRQQPQSINILPNKSSTPSVPFTYNTPNISQGVLSANPQQQEPQTLRERFAFLFPRG
jgi:hypothetical protein